MSERAWGFKSPLAHTERDPRSEILRPGVSSFVGRLRFPRSRRLSTSTTAANPDVEYDDDAAGRVATREDVSGTTTYSYDSLSRLTSRTRPAQIAQIAQVTRMGDEESWTRFALDDKGRRTDTWIRTDEDNTAWAAHSTSTYDPSGRITGIKVESSNWGSNITPVVDITLCYTAGTTAPTCSGTSASDRSLIQWRKDNITGQVASYTYDGANRLTGVSVTAGTDGDGNPLPAETYAYTYDTRGNRPVQTIRPGDTYRLVGGLAEQATQACPGRRVSGRGFFVGGADRRATSALVCWTWRSASRAADGGRLGPRWEDRGLAAFGSERRAAWTATPGTPVTA